MTAIAMRTPGQTPSSAVEDGVLHAAGENAAGKFRRRRISPWIEERGCGGAAVAMLPRLLMAHPEAGAIVTCIRHGAVPRRLQDTRPNHEASFGGIPWRRASASTAALMSSAVKAARHAVGDPGDGARRASGARR